MRQFDTPASTDNLEAEHLKRLLDVGRGLVSKHDLESVLEQVLEAARDLTGSRYAALGILDDEKRELARFLTLGIDDELRQRIGPLPRGYGLLGELIRSPKPLRLRSISEHPRSYGFPAEHPHMETFLGTPVTIRGEVYGNLYLTEKESGEEYSELDEDRLVVLAEWAAIAIENARSYASGKDRRDELERAMRGLEATVSLNRETGLETDLGRILELVVKRARALAEARSCLVLLLDGDELCVGHAAGEVDRKLRGRRMPLEGSAAFDVLRVGRAVAVTGTALASFSTLGINAGSGLLVPLHARGADLGVLAVFDHLGSERFSTDDRLALESFATSAATAIASTRASDDEKARLAIAASERERQRWARELHDETLQELGALTVLQESALQFDDPAALRSALTSSNEQVERIIEGLRRLITELRPAALDQLGVGAALEALVERIEARSGLEIELDVDLAWESGRDPARHTPELEATIYRTVQESLNNVVKHAGARHVRVLVEERGDKVGVTVQDDGEGFDRDASHGGFGLLGMQERVELAGGEVAVASSPAEGTRVVATLPISRLDP